MGLVCFCVSLCLEFALGCYKPPVVWLAFFSFNFGFFEKAIVLNATFYATFYAAAAVFNFYSESDGGSLFY